MRVAVCTAFGTIQTTAVILFGRDERVLCTPSIDLQTTTHRQNAQQLATSPSTGLEAPCISASCVFN